MRTRSWLSAALAAIAGAAIGLPDALAASATVSYTLVAQTGTTKTGSGGWVGAIDALDPPTINESGDVAFRGRTNATNKWAALWYGDLVSGAYTISKVLQQGDDAPDYANVIIGGDGVNNAGFASGFSQPLLRDDGEMAFATGLRPKPPTSGYPPGLTNYGEQAIFKGQPTAIDLIAACPDFFDEDTSRITYYMSVDAGGSMAVYSQLALPKTGHNAVSWYIKAIWPYVQPAMHKGGVYWTPTARDPIGTGTPPAPDNYDAILEEGDAVGNATVYAVPDVVNYFTAVSSSSPGAGHIYGAVSARDNDWSTGDPSNLIAVVEDHPSNGESVFLVAQSDVTDAPGAGTGVKFDNLEFAPAVNNDGDVAFRAQVDGGNWGVWKGVESGSAYSLSKIAYHGDTVPGTVLSFNRFGDPVINGLDEVVFLGQFTQSSATKTGVFRKPNAGALSTIARQSTSTPAVPNAPTRTVGTFDASWGDPSVNTTGNVAFLADVDLTDSTLKSQYQTATGLSVGPAVFVTDYEGTLRTVAAVGMKVQDLIGGSDNRVIIDLQFGSKDIPESTIGADSTLEANGSGHQDGRRVGITNQYLDGSCRDVKIAFWALLKEGALVSQANFVAEISVCPTSGGGGGCTTCLCSTDPDCEMMGMTLNDGPDFNGDGVVDSADIGLTLMAMGYSTGRFDLNKDGFVDSADVAIVTEAYKSQQETQTKEESK